VLYNNASAQRFAPLDVLSIEEWDFTMRNELSLVYYTVRAAIPHIRSRGAGGSIILTSSALGIRAMAYVPHYVAAKAGVIGLMRSLALELAPERIRVNTVNPSIVDTPMIHNRFTYGIFLPGVENPTSEAISDVFATMNPMPTPWIEPEDVSNAVAFLASDEARYVTGLEMKIEEWNFTTHGGYRYVHSTEHGDFRFNGTFHTVRENELVIQTFEFEGAPDMVNIEFMWFEDLGEGRSRLRGRSICPNTEARDALLSSGMEGGMTEGYERLDSLQCSADGPAAKAAASAAEVLEPHVFNVDHVRRALEFEGIGP